MRRLVIIACEVYETELSHLINTSDVGTVYLERTPENLQIARRITRKPVKVLRDIDFMPRLSHSVSLVVHMLPIGLHIDVDELWDEVDRCIGRYKGVADAFLLMYGLCGNALKGVIARTDVTLFYPCHEGTIVDDCVCSILGPDRYLEELGRQGSFFIIPGFAHHRDKMVARIQERTDLPFSDDLTRMMLAEDGYERALVIEEGIETEEDERASCELARRFQLPIERTCGTLALLKDTFEAAIESVR